MNVELKPVSAEIPTFVEAPRCEQLEDLEADVALIGIPYKSPCEVSVPLKAADPASSALSAPDFASRLILNFIGAMAHSGQIGSVRGRGR